MNLKVTVLYFSDADLRLRDEILELHVGDGGRAIIPLSYKEGKQIIAVLAGECHLLNRIGDRVLPLSSASIAAEVDFE
ncbi:TIGR02922 family protein [Neiella marina]|uniref:TIGR02922 family protein n=1 Tax=Neiella holothuriorum TaxID=2870530 RepID=A0ABS7ECN5_9GAMM|nr:TIGR02922 family protein [Neiella holothuriorum]MBW8190089.1 TIGR02922 family protein [Neiella holothuriorum]